VEVSAGPVTRARDGERPLDGRAPRGPPAARPGGGAGRVLLLQPVQTWLA